MHGPFFRWSVRSRKVRERSFLLQCFEISNQAMIFADQSGLPQAGTHGHSATPHRIRICFSLVEKV